MSNPTEWILNTEVRRHICTNKDLMHDFKDVPDGELAFMGNAATTGVMGERKVLKFTYGKSLCLNNVLFVLSLRRNLVFSSLLDIAGFEVNRKAGKIIILHNGVFVGKGYRSGGLCVLNVASDAISGNASCSAYIAESVVLWHGRLGYVNYASINKLKNMQLILNIDIGNCSKMMFVLKQNLLKKPFKSITARKIELLEHVHSDLADFTNTISKGEKKWHIIFVDDFSKYTKVYLLKSKDEAKKIFLKYKTEVENQLDEKSRGLGLTEVGNTIPTP